MWSFVWARRLCADEDGRHAGLIPGAGADRRAGGCHRRLCRALPRAGRVPGGGRRAHAHFPRSRCAVPSNQTEGSGSEHAQGCPCSPDAGHEQAPCLLCMPCSSPLSAFQMHRISSRTHGSTTAWKSNEVSVRPALWCSPRCAGAGSSCCTFHMHACIEAGELSAQAARQRRAPPGWRPSAAPHRGGGGPCGSASARAPTRRLRRPACGRARARVLAATGCTDSGRKSASCRCRRSSPCTPAAHRVGIRVSEKPPIPKGAPPATRAQREAGVSCGEVGRVAAKLRLASCRCRRAARAC